MPVDARRYTSVLLFKSSIFQFNSFVLPAMSVELIFTIAYKLSISLLVTTVLLCSLAVLDPRVGHTMDVLSPFISVICPSDWLFHGSPCCLSRPRDNSLLTSVQNLSTDTMTDNLTAGITLLAQFYSYNVQDYLKRIVLKKKFKLWTKFS